MSINLDMAVLRTFMIGCDLGSFARAAECVGRSQSAVSTQLRRLEEQVGQDLFRRSGRGLVLTEAGEQLLRYARRMLDLNDEVLDALRGSQLEGWVRLGIPQDFAEKWLPGVLGRFARAHPRVNVEVRSEKTSILVEKTRSAELDMCLAWGPAHDAAHAEPVADIPMAWIGRSDSAVGLHDGNRVLPLVAFESPCSFRDPAITALERAGIGWRVAFSSPSLSALWAATAAGLGITMRTRIGLPDGLSVLECSRTGLPDLPSATLSFIQASSDQTGAARMLKDILLQALRDPLAASVVG